MIKTDWKKKATEYALDKKRLNKRVREIEASRDGWKVKANQHKARADKLEAEFNKIKKKLIGLVVPP